MGSVVGSTVRALAAPLGAVVALLVLAGCGDDTDVDTAAPPTIEAPPDGYGEATGILRDAVALTPSGERVELPEHELANRFWGTFAG